MFKDDADRGPLNYSRVVRLHKSVHYRSYPTAATPVVLAGYVPALLARLKLRQE